MGKSTISTGPFSSSQTVSHYQRITISYRLSYYIPWFPNDFPMISHGILLVITSGYKGCLWLVSSAGCHDGQWPGRCSKPAAALDDLQTTRLSTRIDQIFQKVVITWLLPGYYLVITWLFHLFPSDVYRKIFGLLTVNQSASNFRLWRRRFDQLPA